MPIDPAIVKSGDEGRAFILRHTDSPTWKAMDSVKEKLAVLIEAKPA